jgi:NADH-quinone oxidoreductase subunit G
MADVNITVDGKKITAPAGTLLIEACKSAGIEIPSFCYYPGLSLQGACRMCLVRIEKMPKLQTACTTVISEGLAVTSDSEEVRQARKAMLEFVLQNHPLDCPVCDAGGECELQDMTFSYGAAESKLIDIKNHRDEQQWSPVVYFDRPRCIMCYRCVRVCGEGMDVWALGIQNRGSAQVIAPNRQEPGIEDYLWCEECGMCIDICPVGALTSGAYRYKTRPWEMHHVGTICTHCGDGCKTTLGVRRSPNGMEIVRGDNRDKSGINGDFLCIKGRYAFDFADDPRRLKQPMIRRDGKLQSATWEEAFELIGERFKQIKEEHGGQAFGVIGSNRTTNEENYLLQKFARTVLGTNNIDHHRTADFPGFVSALNESPHPVSPNPGETRVGQPTGEDRTASMRDAFFAPAILLIGNNLTDQHPLLAWQIRTNVRLRRARLYVVNSHPIKLRRQAAMFAQISEDNGESEFVHFLAGSDAAILGLPAGETTPEMLSQLRDKLRGEPQLVAIFGSELRAGGIAELVRALPNAKFICLGDYANSRGAADMGLYPDLLPGYVPVGSVGEPLREEWLASAPREPGLDLRSMFDAAKDGRIKAMYIVGSNPIARYGVDPFVLSKPFVIAQEMFLTETAITADVVLPAACAYEKSGTFTNTCGDLQMLKKAGDVEGAKADFEIIVRIAAKMGHDVRRLVPFGRPVRADMGQSRGAQSGEADRHAVWLERQGLEPRLSPFDPIAMLDEIQRLVPGYDVSRLNLAAGNDEHTHLAPAANLPGHAELVVPSEDTLFTSGTLGRFSNTLNSVIERERKEPADKEVAV